MEQNTSFKHLFNRLRNVRKWNMKRSVLPKVVLIFYRQGEKNSGDDISYHFCLHFWGYLNLLHCLRFLCLIAKNQLWEEH